MEIKSSSGGTDPNEARDAERARGKDHVSVAISEGQNKEPPQEKSFKIKGG